MKRIILALTGAMVVFCAQAGAPTVAKAGIAATEYAKPKPGKAKKEKKPKKEKKAKS